MKKLFCTQFIIPVIGMLFPLSLQAAEAKGPYADDLSPAQWMYILMVIVSLVLLAVALVLFKVVMTLQRNILGTTPSVTTAPVIAKPSFWERFWAVKPRFAEADESRDHVYDGIFELNNPAPPWFMYFFYGTVLFAAVYLYRYHIAKTAPLQMEEYAAEMKAGEEQRLAWAKEMANAIDETNVTLNRDVAALGRGKLTFDQFCATCHGKAGEGQAGPNLTDAYWIHGGDIQAVFRTVKYGVPAKGMVSWEKRLNPEQIQEVSSYILSLQGTNPPNAKEPQGTLMQVTTDTLQANQ